MKTAMQELIENYYKIDTIDNFINWFLVNKKRLLEKEKEDKIYFAKKCLDKALDLDIRTLYDMVEQSYDQTYSSNKATFGYISPQTQSNNQSYDQTYSSNKATFGYISPQTQSNKQNK